MESDATATGGNGSTVLDQWSASKIQPIAILYIVAVFAVFIVLSIVVFHSRDAVRALLVAAVGGVAAIVPGILEKGEYRLTESGIEKRTVNTKKPRPFKVVFRWEELDRIAPMKHGFKYFKILNETNPLRRFWKGQICAEFSGEIHVGKQDLQRVLETVRRHGIASR